MTIVKKIDTPEGVRIGDLKIGAVFRNESHYYIKTHRFIEVDNIKYFYCVQLDSGLVFEFRDWDLVKEAKKTELWIFE